MAREEEWDGSLIPEDEDVVREVGRGGLGFLRGGGVLDVWSLVVVVVAMLLLVLRDLVALGVSGTSSKPLSVRSCLVVWECSCLGMAWVSIAGAWIVGFAFGVVVLGWWSVPDMTRTPVVLLGLTNFFNFSFSSSRAAKIGQRKSDGPRYVTLASTMTCVML